VARLRHGTASWRLEGIVQADRRGHRQRTSATWLDTRWRTVTVQTKSGDSLAVPSD